MCTRLRAWVMAVVAGALWPACRDVPLPVLGENGFEPKVEDCKASVVALEVEPQLSDIETGDSREGGIEFRAIAVLASGSRMRVPAAWWVDDLDLGTIDELGRFTASGRAGGRLGVRARAHDVEGASVLGMKLVREFPSDVSFELRERFDGRLPRAAGSGSLRITLPSSGSVFDVAEPPRFDWDGDGHAHFRLHFHNATTDVSLYTDATSIEVPSELRASLVRSSRGRTIRVALEASSDARDIVHRSAEPFELSVCDVGDRCDALDDDCDGTTDESCTPSVESARAGSASVCGSTAAPGGP